MEFAESFLHDVNYRYRQVGMVLESKWNDLLDIVGDDPETLWVWGTNILVLLVYWGYAAFYTFMDLTNRPKFLRKFKIQPGQNEPVDKAKLWHAIQIVLVNLLIVGPIFTYVMFKLVFVVRNTIPIRTLPTLPTVLWNLVVFSLLEEFFFYYAHRLLHHKAVYKYVHKKHHEWTAPIAAITLYANPIEHIVANLFPIGFSVGLCGTHILPAWIFFSMAIINAMSDHTGYEFPFSNKSVRFHDYHHAKFAYNYGIFGWLDKLHGTFRDPTPDKLQKQKLQQRNGTSKKLKSK